VAVTKADRSKIERFPRWREEIEIRSPLDEPELARFFNGDVIQEETTRCGPPGGDGDCMVRDRQGSGGVVDARRPFEEA
jgi:hypothetical protein